MPEFDTSADRFRALAADLDALKATTEARLGADDVRALRRTNAFARLCELAGRALIQLSAGPLSFFTGVILLFLYKQLAAWEIGHAALHGAYDRFPELAPFHSGRHRWEMPANTACWRQAHNVRHHGATNIAGGDTDLHFGPVRLSPHLGTTDAKRRYTALFSLLFLPNFGWLAGLHHAGLSDLLWGDGLGGLDTLPDRSAASVRLVIRRVAVGLGPYLFWDYLFFPALAGPAFAKVILGNFLAGTLRDLFTTLTVISGHVGEDLRSYPAGARPRSRGEWYAMQIEASADLRVPRWLGVLCGGLECQIEHHLFPKLPPQRTREIAAEVERICAERGVAYRRTGWPERLGLVLRQVRALAGEPRSA